MTSTVTPVTAVTGHQSPHPETITKEPPMAAARRVPAGLTVAEFCDELGVSRSTFYDWRAKGRAPRCIKLPNGDIRIRRVEFERWLNTLEEVA